MKTRFAFDLRLTGALRRSSFARFLWHETTGVSAVEFALVSPILLLILAGTVDIGGSLKAKFELSTAVSAGSNYALLNGANVSSAGGSALANNIVAVTASGLSGNGGNVQVVINNGASTSLNASTSVTTQSGTASNADLCYCPTSSGGALTWGSSVTCGSICSGGGMAGKFVTISASKPYSPLFGGLDVVQGGNITVQSVIQPQ
ncbi:pilus assembly protein [Mesorhizobium sp. PAMC28654]|uniref:TadE/TadG family type IV pilus assembly protein n=1 Tax=Mesorhizobium sp. PAMC28654 TaxID=2880934 RepID=UPI001D0A4508|nr:TadE/TadG family type IV pilus assembly protein [Mesorhizobium sp. PAMC28654]UDL91347.1 pilus assembly protein [Mesorhizobium sp. PAMC28654]